MKKKFAAVARRFELTEREREVCWKLLSGYSPKEIAFELDVTIWAVNFHKRGIFKKLKSVLLRGFFLK